MKTKFYLLILAVLAFAPVFAQETIHDLDFSVQRADVSVADIDGDSDQDILILGENPDGRFVQLFQNNGDMTFEKVESVIATTWVPSVDFGDYNRDGRLDIIHSGFGDSVTVNLYTTNAAGALVLDELYRELIHIAPSAGFTDINNDGIIDIFVFGNHNIGDQRPKLYLGKADGTFEATSPFDNFKFIDNKVVDVDVDNDGDLDLWVMAGYEEGIDARFARLFINTNGSFEEKDLNIIAKGPGSSDWGDYDGDGDLDLLIGGWGYVNSGEDNDLIYRIYRNTGGNFAEAVVFQPYGQFGVGDGGRFADWDNDGDLDVILTGWNPDEGGQRTAFFINSGGEFARAEYSTTVPGFSESALEIGDLDGDGDLDVVVTGFSGNAWNGEGSAFNKNASVIIENTTAGTNEAPSAPANLEVTVSGQNVTFSWDEAEDDKTPGISLTYNLFLVDAEGTFYYTPLADTTTGKLVVQEKGNVQLNNSWTVKGLPYGTYRWGVQAIDNSFAGSAFAKSTLNHVEGGEEVLAVTKGTGMAVFPNPSAGQVQVRAEAGMAALSVLTLDGKLLLHQPLTGAQHIQLNLNAGTYILRAHYSDGHMSAEKLIVR